MRGLLKDRGARGQNQDPVDRKQKIEDKGQLDIYEFFWIPASCLLFSSVLLN
jgi:hypothetical protein